MTGKASVRQFALKGNLDTWSDRKRRQLGTITTRTPFNCTVVTEKIGRGIGFRRILRLLELYKATRKEEGLPPPNIVSLEKIVAYHYPSLREQTRRAYAKIMYGRLVRKQTKNNIQPE